MPLLFSYGTLQLKKVQLASFGRILTGTKDSLKGYVLNQLQITDADVLAKSEQVFHPIAEISDNKNDQIDGMLFEVTDKELAQADAYEVADYKRIETLFVSGKKGWIYIKS
ncbi:gamma-glutamylcyclotransferase family protein [Ochrovirga pacifica]|uniref:gamma-glutamylcyclotransferase family protein n=1 Tax=Ochrovirga pacifica TaxID=1042376 RepID=UPI0002559ACB|nr:gamma-glutamylcyclotransferase family protein [Ochrovirga pacifica]